MPEVTTKSPLDELIDIIQKDLPIMEEARRYASEIQDNDFANYEHGCINSSKMFLQSLIELKEVYYYE